MVAFKYACHLKKGVLEQCYAFQEVFFPDVRVYSADFYSHAEKMFLLQTEISYVNIQIANNNI